MQKVEGKTYLWYKPKGKRQLRLAIITPQTPQTSIRDKHNNITEKSLAPKCSLIPQITIIEQIKTSKRSLGKA